MKKGIKENTGDLIKVPFKEKLHTYARILLEGSYAIYDCASTTDKSDYDIIIQSDILFIAKVDIFALKEGFWTIVGNLPLEDRLKEFYPRYFNPAPSNPVNIAFYEVYQNDIEAAIKQDWIKTGRLQLDGIHGNVHVETRIRDYYDGKMNEDNKEHIELFKKLTGLGTV